MRDLVLYTEFFCDGIYVYSYMLLLWMIVCLCSCAFFVDGTFFFFLFFCWYFYFILQPFFVSYIIFHHFHVTYIFFIIIPIFYLRRGCNIYPCTIFWKIFFLLQSGQYNKTLLSFLHEAVFHKNVNIPDPSESSKHAEIKFAMFWSLSTVFWNQPLVLQSVSTDFAKHYLHDFELLY